MEKSTKLIKPKRKYEKPKVEKFSETGDFLGWSDCIEFVDTATEWPMTISLEGGSRQIVTYLDPFSKEMVALYRPLYPINYIKLELTC